MRLLACLTSLLLSSTLALAQAPSPAAPLSKEALDHARTLGEQWSESGLEEIIARHDGRELEAYESGFRKESMKRSNAAPGHRASMPPRIEAIIAAHYDDPALKPALRSFFFQSWLRYQSRAMFDHLYAELPESGPRSSFTPIYQMIIATDQPDVEEPLLQYLRRAQRPPSDGAMTLTYLFGQRRYAPAVPVLAEMLESVPPGKGTPIDANLAKIATPEAVDALVRRLAMLNAAPMRASARDEPQRILQMLSELAPEATPEYSAVRRAVPRDLDDAQGAYLIYIARKRGGEAATADLIAFLGDRKLYNPAIQAILQLDSPDAWRKALAHVEQLRAEGGIEDGAYRFASSTLQAKIGDPAKHFAEKAQAARARELESRRRALPAAPRTLVGLRREDPARYAEQVEDYLAQAEALASEFSDIPSSTGLRQETANAYVELGHFVRFGLKQPQRALELYAGGTRMRASGSDFATADLRQFDLHDKPGALAIYRSMAAAPAQGHGNDLEVSVERFSREWARHQVAYLEKGETFTGALSMDDCSVPALVMTYGTQLGADALEPLGLPKLPLGSGAPGKAESPGHARALAAALEALPSSAVILMDTARLVDALPDAATIMRYVTRHDPAGFATACGFAAVEKSGVPASAALRQAAARFARTHRTTAGPAR